MNIFELFTKIIYCLENDNGCKFQVYPRDYKEIYTPLKTLFIAGYFRDDYKDLTSDFWCAAAGEKTEAKEYFSKNEKCTKAYKKVSRVLDRIFNR